MADVAPGAPGDDSVQGDGAGPVRDRARGSRPPDRRARGSSLSVLAHGIGGVKDLPVPGWLFLWGAAVVLVLSFLALGALWKRPQLERRAPGRPFPAGLERVLRSVALRVVVGALSAGLLALVFLTALIGEPSSAVEPRADVRAHDLLARARAGAGAVRQRLVGAQPVACRRRRRRMGLAQAGAGVDAAARLPGAARRLARGVRALLLRRARARLRRALEPAGAGARDRALQLRDVVRDGRGRPEGVGRARQRLHRLLRPARPDRAVRRARRQARPADAVLRARRLGADAGDARVHRRDARLGRLRRAQPRTVLAEPPRRSRTALHRRRAGDGGAALDRARARRHPRVRSAGRGHIPWGDEDRRAHGASPTGRWRQSSCRASCRSRSSTRSRTTSRCS